MANTYYIKFIEFFQNHNLYDEEMFKYIRANSIMFDYREEEKRPFIGCYYVYNKDILTKISLCVPFIDDEKTLLINIHEYIHAITLYNKLDKKYKPGIDIEVLPMLYERIYINENPSKELENYLDNLNEQIYLNPEPKYILALKVQKELIEHYSKNKSIKDLNKKVKKLTRKNK